MGMDSSQISRIINVIQDTLKNIVEEDKKNVHHNEIKVFPLNCLHTNILY